MDLSKLAELLGKGVFSDGEIEQVWKKGVETPGDDPKKWRDDKCNATICRWRYGKQERFGWEIHHVIPRSKGGTDEMGNLIPLQWENNRATGDDRNLSCVVKS